MNTLEDNLGLVGIHETLSSALLLRLVKHFRAMLLNQKPNMVRKSIFIPLFVRGGGCQQLLTIGFIDCDITNVGRRGGMCVIQRQVIRHKSHYCQRIHTSYSLWEIASYKIFPTKAAPVVATLVGYFCHWFIWCLFGSCWDFRLAGSRSRRRLPAQLGSASLTVWGKVLIVCDINLGRWHPNFVLGNCQHQHSQCSHHMITAQPRRCHHHSHTTLHSINFLNNIKHLHCFIV